MFKVGDRVRCINASGAIERGLVEGKEYTVTDVDFYGDIKFEKFGCWFSESRFKLVHRFKRGDRVLVGDTKDGIDEESIFLTYIKGAERPYVCVYEDDEDKFKNGEKFIIDPFRYAKPIQQKRTVTLELTDEQLEKIKEIL